MTRGPERDRLAGTGADALAAVGAGGLIDDGLRRQSNTRKEANGRRRTGIAAGTAEDAGFGEAAVADQRDRFGEELTAKQGAARWARAFHGGLNGRGDR